MSPRCRKILSHGKGPCGRFNPRNVTAGHCQELIIESICVITLVIGFIIFSLFYLLTQLSSRSTPSNSMPTRRHRSRIRNIDNHSRSNSESKITPVSAAGSTRDFQPHNIIRRERSSSFDRRQRVNQSPRDSINEELQNFKRNKWKSLMEQSFNGKNDQMRYIGMSPTESLENIAEEKIEPQADSTNPQKTITDTENAIPKLDETKEFASENESGGNKMSSKQHKEFESNTFGRNIKANSLTKNRDIISSDPNQKMLSPTQTHNVKTDIKISNIKPRSPRLSNDNNEERLPDAKNNLPSLMKQNKEEKVYNDTEANSIQKIVSPRKIHNEATNGQVSNISPRSPRLSKDNNKEGLSGAKDNSPDLTKQKTEPKVYDDFYEKTIKLGEEENDDTQIISPNAKLNKAEEENASVSITKDAVNDKTPIMSDLNSKKESENNDNITSSNVVGSKLFKGSNNKELLKTREIHSNQKNINSKNNSNTKGLSNENEQDTSADLNANNTKNQESNILLEAVKKLQDSLVYLPVDSNKLQKSSERDNHKTENINIRGERNKENNEITQPADDSKHWTSKNYVNHHLSKEDREIENTEYDREKINHISNVNHNEVEDLTDDINNRQNIKFSKSSKLDPKGDTKIENQHEISDKKNKQVNDEKNTSEQTHLNELNNNHNSSSKNIKSESNKPDNETTQEMEPSNVNSVYISNKRNDQQPIKNHTDVENKEHIDTNNNNEINKVNNEKNTPEQTHLNKRHNNHKSDTNKNNTEYTQQKEPSNDNTVYISTKRNENHQPNEEDPNIENQEYTVKNNNHENNNQVNNEKLTVEQTHLKKLTNNHTANSKKNKTNSNKPNDETTQQIEPSNAHSSYFANKRNGSQLIREDPDVENEEYNHTMYNYETSKVNIEKFTSEQKHLNKHYNNHNKDNKTESNKPNNEIFQQIGPSIDNEEYNETMHYYETNKVNNEKFTAEQTHLKKQNDNHKADSKKPSNEYISSIRNGNHQPNKEDPNLENQEYNDENNNHKSAVNYNKVKDFAEIINNPNRSQSTKSSKIIPKTDIKTEKEQKISDKKTDFSRFSSEYQREQVSGEKNTAGTSNIEEDNNNENKENINRNTEENKVNFELTAPLTHTNATSEHISTKRHGNDQSINEDLGLENQGYDDKINHNKVEEFTDVRNNTPKRQFAKASKIPKTGNKLEKQHRLSDKKTDLSMYETSETPKVKVNDENFTAELSHLNESYNNHKNKINTEEENKVNNLTTQQIEPSNDTQHSSIKRNGNHLQVEKELDQENDHRKIIHKSAAKNNNVDPIDLFPDKHSEKIHNDTSASQNILFSDKHYEKANNKSEPIVNEFKNHKNQELKQDLSGKIKKESVYKPSTHPSKQIHEQDGSLNDVINNKQKGQYSKSPKVIPKAGIEMEKYPQHDQEPDKPLPTSSENAKTQVNGEKSSAETPHFKELITLQTYAKASKPLSHQKQKEEKRENNNKRSHSDTNNKESLQKLKKSDSRCVCDGDESKNSKRGEIIRRDISKQTDSKPLNSNKNIAIDKNDNPSEFNYKSKNGSNKKLYQRVSDHLCGCSTTRSSKVLADEVQKTYAKSTEPPFSKSNRASKDICGCDNFQYTKQSTNKTMKTNLKASTIDTRQTYAKATTPPSANRYQDKSEARDKYKIKQEPSGNSKPIISDDLCRCDDSHSMQQTTVQLSPTHFEGLTNDTPETYGTMSNTNQTKHELEKVKLEKAHISDDHCKCDDDNKLLKPADQSHVSSAQILEETGESHIKNGLCACDETQNVKSSLHGPFQKTNSKLDETMRIMDEKYHLPAGPHEKSGMESEAFQERITQQDIDGFCECDEASNPQAICLKSTKENIEGNKNKTYAKSTKPPFLRDKKERAQSNNPLHRTYNDLTHKKFISTKESPYASCNKPENCTLRESRSQKSSGMRSQKSTASMKKSLSQIRGKLSAQNSSHSPKTIRVPLQDMLQCVPKLCQGSDGRINKAQFGKNIAKLKAERQRQSLRNAEQAKIKTENPNLVTGCSKHCLGVLGQISKDQLKYFEDFLSKGASYQDKIYTNGSRNEITQPQTQLNISQLQQNTSESVTRLPQSDSLLDCDRCRTDDVKKTYSNSTTIPMSTTATEDTFVRDIIATSTPNTSATALRSSANTCDAEECKELLKKPLKK